MVTPLPWLLAGPMSPEMFGTDQLATLDDFRNWVGLGLEARERK